MDLLGDIGGIVAGANPVTALIGGALGGVFRLVPEVFRLFTSRRDQDHEYRMATLQRDMAKDGSEQRIRETEAAGAVVLDGKGMDAFVAAITAQGQKTGIWWADALSATVRPIATYWWLALYTAVKVALIVAGWGKVGGSAAVLSVWGAEDSAMLFGIMNFWFLDRVIRRRAG